MAGSRSWSTLFENGSYFECPRWHEGRWWAVDFYRHGVFTYDGSGGEELVLEVEGQPSGLGWLPDGDLLVVSMRDRRVLRCSARDGTVTEHADVAHLVAGHLNDLVVGRTGIAYAGNFGFDLMSGADPVPTVLVRIDPDGSPSVAAQDLWFPNGTVITEDGTTLIVAETFGGRLAQFTIAADGSLVDRRAFAQIDPPPEPGGDVTAMIAGATFAPDGITLDAEGHVWAANAVAGAVCRVAPGGGIVEEIAMPEGLGTFACQLGGEDGRTLVACAAPDFYEHERRDRREALLLTTTVEVPHAGLP